MSNAEAPDRTSYLVPAAGIMADFDVAPEAPLVHVRLYTKDPQSLMGGPTQFAATPFGLRFLADFLQKAADDAERQNRRATVVRAARSTGLLEVMVNSNHLRNL